MDDKERENHLRRQVERQGLALRMAPQQDSQAPEYGKFQIINPGSNTVIAGNEPHAYSLTLDDVEAWLATDEATPQASIESSPYRARQASKDAETRTSGGGTDKHDGESSERGAGSSST